MWEAGIDFTAAVAAISIALLGSSAGITLRVAVDGVVAPVAAVVAVVLTVEASEPSFAVAGKKTKGTSDGLFS